MFEQLKRFGRLLFLAGLGELLLIAAVISFS